MCVYNKHRLFIYIYKVPTRADHKYVFHTWYSQYSIFAQIWFCYLLFLVVLMQIFLVPSLILCLVTFDCEYVFFRALLKGLFETMHLNKDCVFGSTNNLGTFKMNYWVLGLRKTMIVVKPSGIPFVHRRLLSVLSPRRRPRFCVLFLCLAVFKRQAQSCRFWHMARKWILAWMPSHH